MLNLEPMQFELLTVTILKIVLGFHIKPTRMNADYGIDGIGKDHKNRRVILQTKRIRKNVGAGDMLKFLGSIVYANSTYGVFITTSDFTKNSVNVARKNKKYKIIMIGGKALLHIIDLARRKISTRS